MKQVISTFVIVMFVGAAGCSREVSSEGPPSAAPAAPKAPEAPARDDGARPPDAAATAKPTPPVAARAAAAEPAYREITIPAGTVLPVELQTTVSSEKSDVEDAVRGTLRRAVTVDGVEVLPPGTTLAGHVTVAERSARVKGRARAGFRFTTLDPPGDAERIAIRTNSVTAQAQATKKQDAAKIGGGAVGGAIVGGLLGGGDGAAKGAAIGGAAGTGVVLATRGKEVRFAEGTPVSVKLAAPVTIRVRR
jgi:hypothetical protein